MRERDPGEEPIRDLLAADDPAALELIWDRYAAALHAFAASLAGSCADAEEVVQQVFLKVARMRGRIARARSIRAYLYAMTRNEAMNVLRRRKRWVEMPDEAAWLVAAEAPQAPGLSPDEAARLLASLPARQREVVSLKVFCGMTFQEIAGALGVSANTAASRYRYGLEKLRKLFGEDAP
ncbi:MAG: sigma-70 family RNA polymerase sigma factor [Lentisphaeria bacterium]|nr:sigma-70 family RNA polymerase sigma factor [Lentisphaeria bacterium]